jgi:phosphopantetheine--protein transferase-like protein
LRSHRVIARQRLARRRSREIELSVGCDLVHLREFHKRLKPRFVERAFTPGEIHDALDKGDALASLGARWAAKEAAFKAFSQAAEERGLERKGLGVFRHYEVRGRNLILDGKPKALLALLRAKISLSLTHDGDYAAAFVVIAS